MQTTRKGSESDRRPEGGAGMTLAEALNAAPRRFGVRRVHGVNAYTNETFVVREENGIVRITGYKADPCRPRGPVTKWDQKIEPAGVAWQPFNIEEITRSARDEVLA